MPKNKVHRILTVFAAGSALFIGGTTSMAAQTPVAARSSSPSTTVTVWTWRPQDRTLWQEVQNALNAKGDNINIVFRSINGAQYGSTLQTAMDGGDGPDVYYVGASAPAPYKFAEGGLAKPLNGIVNTSEISKADLNYAQYKGKIYGIPFAVQTLEWFYNKDIFTKYHLQPPKTWSDLLRICQVLQKNGVTPISSMGEGLWGSASQMWSFETVSASLLSKSYLNKLVVDRSAKFTDPQFVRALTAFQQLSRYYEPNWQAEGATGTEMQSYFAMGKSGMIIDGIWDVGASFLKDNPAMKIGAFMTPSFSASQPPRIDWYVDGTIDMNSHISSPNVVKASQEIMKFIATKQFGQDFTNIAGDISPITGVKIPSSYPLSIQANGWLQKYATILWGEHSSLDMPPATTGNTISADAPVSTAEIQLMVPFMLKESTPQKTAREFQKDLSWYFKR